MEKPTTLREAFKRWEEKHPDQKISEAKEVSLCFQWPPIEKMDSALDMLVNCEKLSLSSNNIDRITGLAKLQNLKILALGRNKIKNFNGLEVLADSLEQLWISYNSIERMRTVIALRNLKVLYMTYNLVKDWAEFGNLASLPKLEDLAFLGNPLEENYENKVAWRQEVKQKVPNLEKLDGVLFV
ncbi:dynein axonemal light chain 1-like [Bacillus rossius redtenbacheri]|uniref:dynein axonemal light chain 1-like n=1 Tax=Bacillus rossius redtenbacheri TaxID=93214 RepID=UPI002FDDB295